MALSDGYFIKQISWTATVSLCYHFRTLEERAMRLFSTKGKNLEELDHAMFAKSKPGRAGKTRYL